MNRAAEFLFTVFFVALVWFGWSAAHGCNVQINDKLFYVGPPRDAGSK